MLRKFCPYKDTPILPAIMFPATLKPNYLIDLIKSLTSYRRDKRKCITRVYYKPMYNLTSSVNMDIEPKNFEIRSYDYVIVENSLISIMFLNIFIKQKYKYTPYIALANSFAYYLRLLF